MFTIDDIKYAHRSIVKSGADFPRYVQRLIELGVVRYETYVSDGHTVYYGVGNHQPATDAVYAPIPVAPTANQQQFAARLKIHQQGQTDYMTFCKDAGAAGVQKWITDTTAMTCTYYDATEQEVLSEKIPAV